MVGRRGNLSRRHRGRQRKVAESQSLLHRLREPVSRRHSVKFDSFQI